VKKKFFITGLFLFVFGLVNSLAYAKNFDDYSFILKLFGSVQFGNLNGTIMDEERNFWTLRVSYSDGTSQYGKPDPKAEIWGINGEILWNRFGFVLSYNPIQIKESVEVGDGRDYEKKEYSGGLISGNGFYGGVNYHIPFGNSGDEFLGSFYFGVKAGYLSAALKPYASYFSYLGVLDNIKSFPLNGFSICPNIGLNFIVNFIVIGLSGSYYFDSYSSTESLVGIYQNTDRAISYNYFTLDFFIGLAF
jgi:hypothetical protein